jgi:hypothetical protein
MPALATGLTLSSRLVSVFVIIAIIAAILILVKDVGDRV